MRSLTKLDLSGDDGKYRDSCGPMSIRALPEGFEELKLAELNMGHCDNLNHEEALEIIIKIDTLTSLDLTNWKMSSLPEGFGQLINLKKLDISWTRIVTLPEGIMHQTIH